MDSILSQGKTFISSRRANQLSGYSMDYIGQLCRAGKVEATQVGRVWFVTEESLMGYKAQSEELAQKRHQEQSELSKSIYTAEEALLPKLTKSVKMGGGNSHKKIPHQLSFSDSLSRAFLSLMLVGSAAVGIFTLGDATFPEIALAEFGQTFAGVYRDIASVPRTLAKNISGGLEAFDEIAEKRPVVRKLALGLKDSLFKGNEPLLALGFVGGAVDVAHDSFATGMAKATGGTNSLASVPGSGFVKKLFSFFSNSADDNGTVIAPTILAQVATTSDLLSGAKVPVLTVATSTGRIAKTEETMNFVGAAPRVIERVINNTVTNNTVERVLVGDVTRAELDARLADIYGKIQSQLSALGTGSGGSVANIYQSIAQTQKIDTLSNVTITNPTISGGNFTNITVSGGSVSSAPSVSTAELTVTGVATSSFAGGINLTSGCFAVNGVCLTSGGGGGGGTGTVNSGLAGQVAYFDADGTAVSGTSTVFVLPNGNVGIGTTTFTGSHAGKLVVDQTHDAQTVLRVTNYSDTANAYSELSVRAGNVTSYLGSTPQNSSVVTGAGSAGRGYVWSQSTGANRGLDLVAASANSDLRFYTAGIAAANERMRITASGDVGIGTTSPAYKLHVYAGTGSATQNIQTADAGGEAAINLENTVRRWKLKATTAAGDAFVIRDQTASQDRFVINGAGNIGIGSTSPSSKLSVLGDSYFGGNVNIRATGSGPQLTVNALGNGNDTELILGDGLGEYWGITRENSVGNAARGDLSFYSTDSRAGDLLTLGARGLVGVGTTSPYAKLSVAGTSAASTTFAIRPVSGQTANILDIYSTSGVLDTVITAAGNVGIGTSTVSRKFVVDNGLNSGTLATFQSNAVGADVGLRINNSAVSSGSLSETSVLNFAFNDFVGASIIGGKTEDFTSSANRSGYLAFNVRKDNIFSEAARISSNGNLGIGTTSPGAKFAINSLTSDPAAQSLFLVASSTNIATTTHFVITSSGSVGISTTSPGTKLAVEGNSNFSGLVTIGSNSDAPQLVVRAVSGQSSNAVEFRGADNVARLSFYDLNNSPRIFFNYGPGNGGDFTGQLEGLDQLSFGFNNAGSFGGASGDESGRLLYFFDRIAGQYRGAVGPEGDLFWGTDAAAGYSVKLGTPDSLKTALTVQGASGQTANYFEVNSNGATGGDVAVINAQGNVGIGTTDPATHFANSWGSGLGLGVVSGADTATIGVRSQSSAGYSFFDQANDLGQSLLFGTYGSSYDDGVGNTWFGVPKTGNSFMFTYWDSSLSIGTFGNKNLTLGTNNLARMTVLGGGNVGIGTTSPYAALSVAGASGVVAQKFTATSTTATSSISGGLSVGSTNSLAKLHVSAQAPNNPVAYFVNTNTGANDEVLHLGVGAASAGTSNLYVSFYQESSDSSRGTRIGYIQGSGSNSVTYNTTSDVRLKENVHDTALGLEDLLKIGVKDYNFKTSPGKTVQGFIAQDLNKIYPYAVATTDDGVSPLGINNIPWGVDYGRITPLIVKSIQDQYALYKKLEGRVAEIEARIASSSVATVSNAGSGGFSMDSVISVLQSAGLSLVNGVTSVKDLVAETATVGSELKPTGITLYDKQTGQPYCLEISNGSMVQTPGKCAVTLRNPNPVVPPPVEPPAEVSTSTDSGAPVASSTPPVNPPVEELVVDVATSTVISPNETNETNETQN